MEILKEFMLQSYCFLLFGFISGLLCINQSEDNNIALGDTVFVVTTQSNAYHLEKAEEFKTHFYSQLTLQDNSEAPALIFTHDKWPDSLPWTILSIIPDLAAEYSETINWIFFCEEDTRIDLKKFIKAKKQFDPQKELFLGKALRDKAATIIHHFAHHANPDSFAYPDFRAGMLMSIALVKGIANKLKTKSLFTDFVIDAKHELAMFVWDEGKGASLTPSPAFCTNQPDREACATYSTAEFPNCGPSVADSDVYIAVKTCKDFHHTRVPIVKDTWGKESESIEYVSEEADASVPTISLGVPNTKSGHCGKTFAILKRAVEHESLKSKKWIIIVDDDTIISIKRLKRLLACYNPDEAVVLGERYGYASYEYITGGGGMIFSRVAVEKLMASDCSCSANDSPDDMILGICFRSLGIPLTHSPLFHQARPDDYSDGYLGNHAQHISFHKHWETDPVMIYNSLLVDKDLHDEL